MNKEIEEALRHFQEAVDSKKGPIMFDYTIAIKDVELLLSYIDDLKEQIDYQDVWRKEYISRIDKAIEYIEYDYDRNE